MTLNCKWKQLNRKKFLTFPRKLRIFNIRSRINNNKKIIAQIYLEKRFECSFSKNLCDKKLHLIIGSISYSLISIFDHQYELPVRVSIESYFFRVSRQVVKYHRKLYHRIECVTVGTRRLIVGNPSSNLGHVVSRVA